MFRRLLDADFTLAGKLDVSRRSDGSVLLDSPPHVRFANPRDLQLNKYGLGPFSRLQVPPLPNGPGIYAVWDDHSDRVLYVGRARDSLRERWGRRGYSVIDPRNCFVGGQSTNCRINALVTRAAGEGKPLSLWTHQIPQPDTLEDQLIRHLRPLWNIR